MAERTCLQCGRSFVPYGSQKCCSDTCSKARIKDYDRARSGKPRGPSIRVAYVRTDELDPHYWKDLNSPVKCWLLGLVVTDGNVNQNKVRFHIQRADQEVLEYVKSLLGSGASIQLTKTGVSFALSCVEWCRDLAKLGIRENKSLNVAYTECPFPWDYVRGLMDGDGHVPWSCSPEFYGSSVLLMEGVEIWMKGRGYSPHSYTYPPREPDHDVKHMKLTLPVADACDFLPKVYYQRPYIQRKYDRVKQVLAARGISL